MHRPLSRRQALQLATASLACSAIPAARGAFPVAAGRKFTIDLTPGAIGVQAGFPALVDLAARHGFESVAPDPAYLATLSDAQRDDLLASMKAKHLTFGAAGLPVEFRRDEATFRQGLEQLPTAALALQKAGATRVGTYIMPNSDELTYMANFQRHADRLREVARVLGDHGLRFGLEYVGPKTLWTARKYPFLHTLAETRELIAAIGRPKVGLVLDSWHWYTAGETVEDLKTLTNEDVVACDLNDAPADLAIDQQIDSRRELPVATGVIDLKSFLETLVSIGYDGPVRAEPFNAPLNAMGDDDALAATSAALRKAVGLLE